MEKKARFEDHKKNTVAMEESGLPVVLQVMILTFLSVSDHLGTASRLSKHWLRLTLLPSSWGPNIDLFFMDQVTDVHFGKHFAKTRAQHFRLYCCSYKNAAKTASSEALTFFTLTTLPSTLTSLTLHVSHLGRHATETLTHIPTARLRRFHYTGQWNAESSKWLQSAAPTLEHLTIAIRPPFARFGLLPALDNLKTLECSVRNLEQLEDAVSCPALTKLNLSDAYTVEDKDLTKAFHRHAPSLQRLQTIIMDGTELSGQCFKSFYHLRGLRRLTLDADDPEVDGPMVYSQDLSHLAHLPLTCLHLGPYIDHTAFAHLVQMPLTELGLHLSFQSDAAAVMKAFLNCGPLRASLQVLSLIDDAEHLDDAGLCNVLDQLPKLERLSTSSRRLTEDGMAKLASLYPRLVVDYSFRDD